MAWLLADRSLVRFVGRVPCMPLHALTIDLHATADGATLYMGISLVDSFFFPNHDTDTHSSRRLKKEG
jgi:hypothetical protein